MTTNTLGQLSRVAEYDVFVLTAGIWFLAKLLRYAGFSTVSGGAEFGISNALLGMAFTTMMADYTLSQFPGGALADRLGGGRIIVVGGITAATGTLVVGTVTRFSTLVGGDSDRARYRRPQNRLHRPAFVALSRPNRPSSRAVRHCWYPRRRRRVARSRPCDR